MAKTTATISIHGHPVPALDYETLRQLEHIAFGLTPSDWPESMAHKIAIEAAIEGLDVMRLYVRFRKNKS